MSPDPVILLCIYQACGQHNVTACSCMNGRFYRTDSHIQFLETERQRDLDRDRDRKAYLEKKTESQT